MTTLDALLSLDSDLPVAPVDLTAEWRQQAATALAHLESEAAHACRLPAATPVGLRRQVEAQDRLAEAQAHAAELSRTTSPRRVAELAALIVAEWCQDPQVAGQDPAIWGEQAAAWPRTRDQLRGWAVLAAEPS